MKEYLHNKPEDAMKVNPAINALVFPFFITTTHLFRINFRKANKIEETSRILDPLEL